MAARRTSRYNDRRFARTRAQYMGPIAVIFTAFWLYGLALLIEGLARSNGGHIVMGLLISATVWWLVRVSWRNYRSAVADQRKVKERGSLR
jgi:hypothetical protein